MAGEVIERVAKELLAHCVCTERGEVENLRLMRLAARAAIAAMREPTEEMNKAGSGDHNGNLKYGDGTEGETSAGMCADSGRVQPIWRAMIDAALK